MKRSCSPSTPRRYKMSPWRGGEKSFHSVVFVFFSLRYFSHWSNIRHLNSTTLMNTRGGATHSGPSSPSLLHSWLHCGCCMPWRLLQGHWNRYCDRVLKDNTVQLYFMTIVAQVVCTLMPFAVNFCLKIFCCCVAVTDLQYELCVLPLFFACRGWKLCAQQQRTWMLEAPRRQSPVNRQFSPSQTSTRCKRMKTTSLQASCEVCNSKPPRFGCFLLPNDAV